MYLFCKVNKIVEDKQQFTEKMCNFAPMKTKLLLVRHGETVDNANKIMQGQTQGQLNDTGIGQA